MEIQEMRDIILAHSIPEPNSGCWLWLGSVSNGYGIIFINTYAKFLAHRISYEAFITKPINQAVRHLCNNSYCVNPEHLADGTHKENAQDKEKLRLAKKRAINPAYRWWLQ